MELFRWDYITQMANPDQFLRPYGCNFDYSLHYKHYQYSKVHEFTDKKRSWVAKSLFHLTLRGFTSWACLLSFFDRIWRRYMLSSDAICYRNNYELLFLSAHDYSYAFTSPFDFLKDKKLG